MPPRRRTARPSAFRPPLLALTLGFAVACRDSTEPGEVTTRIGVGALASPASAALVAPDTVTAGTAFTVTVRTAGNACVASAGGEVRVRGLVATVTPYDMHYVGVFCADILTQPTRTVLVRFDEPGTATVRAVGANGATAERTVVVRPLGQR